MSQLILLRHGQSDWNKKNLFAGWVNIPLTEEGVNEALLAGEEIKNIPLDAIFVSNLIRAQATAMLAMTKHASGKTTVMVPKENELKDRMKSFGVDIESECIPMYDAWQLNERYYGELQGRNRQEVAEQYGAEQVKIWRRSYDVPPPNGESLQMTAERTLPYFKEKILPYLEKGKNVLIVAHGNSLRSIVMFLENFTREEVLAFDLLTGKPRYYTYDNGEFILR